MGFRGTAPSPRASQALVTEAVRQLGHPTHRALDAQQTFLFFFYFTQGWVFFFFLFFFPPLNSSRRVFIIAYGVTVSLKQLKQMRAGKAWLSTAAVRGCAGRPDPARGCCRGRALSPSASTQAEGDRPVPAGFCSPSNFCLSVWPQFLTSL